MRIAMGCIAHETNTFSSLITDRESFNLDQTLYLGQEIIENFKNTHTMIRAYMDACQAHGFSLLPLICAEVKPSGVIQQDFYDELKEMLLHRLTDLGRVDGVVLKLHGAMVASETDDVEGDILSAVRDTVGSNVPVVANLDLHANVSRRMIESADVLVGYDTYPHVDMYERGLEAVHIMHRILEEGMRPTIAYHKLPLFWSVTKQITNELPMKDVMDLAHGIEKETGIVNVTVSTGFPHADIEDAGASVTVTAENDPELAQRKADELASYIWKRRRDWQDSLMSVREAIKLGQSEQKYPVIFADISDSPGGGDSCDGTEILRVFLEYDVQDAVVAAITDPDSVLKAIEAGIGNEVTLSVGGKIDNLHGAPVLLTGRVTIISDGTFILKGPMETGSVEKMGRTVVIKSKRTEIIITEWRPMATYDTQLLRSVGIEPLDRKFIAVKSGVHFRASYAPIAGNIYNVDTPGTQTVNFASLTYKKIKRPLYPIDEM